MENIKLPTPMGSHLANDLIWFVYAEKQKFNSKLESLHNTANLIGENILKNHDFIV